MENRQLSADELSMMDSKAFALKLMDWHQCGDTGLYRVGRVLFAGGDQKADDVKHAKKMLFDLDKMETKALATELDKRFPQETKMTEAQMVSWVQRNCKFAAVKKQAGILDFLGNSLNGLKDPNQVFQVVMKAYQTRAQQGMGQTTPADVANDAKQIDEKFFGGYPVLSKQVPALSKAVMQPAPAAAAPVAKPPMSVGTPAAPAAAPAAPAAAKPPMSTGTPQAPAPGPRFQPDPVEQFMAQKRKQQTMV